MKVVFISFKKFMFLITEILLKGSSLVLLGPTNVGICVFNV